MKTFFWVLWGFDAVISLVIVGFFIAGVLDGSVSSFNIGLWSMLLVGAAVVMAGSLWLRSIGRRRQAIGLLMIPAMPGLMFAVFFLAVLILHPRWN